MFILNIVICICLFSYWYIVIIVILWFEYLIDVKLYVMKIVYILKEDKLVYI